MAVFILICAFFWAALILLITDLNAVLIISEQHKFIPTSKLITKLIRHCYTLPQPHIDVKYASWKQQQQTQTHDRSPPVGSMAWPQSLNVVAAFRASIQPKVTAMIPSLWLIPVFCRIISPKRKGRKIGIRIEWELNDQRSSTITSSTMNIDQPPGAVKVECWSGRW